MNSTFHWKMEKKERDKDIEIQANLGVEGCMLVITSAPLF